MLLIHTMLLIAWIDLTQVTDSSHTHTKIKIRKLISFTLGAVQVSRDHILTYSRHPPSPLIMRYLNKYLRQRYMYIKAINR